MSDLHLDFAELGAAASRVDRIRATFSRALTVAHDTASLTGHEGLASKVREFADSWDVSREQLSKRLEYVAGALRAIVDTFSELDGKLRAEAWRVGGYGADGGR